MINGLSKYTKNASSAVAYFLDDKYFKVIEGDEVNQDTYDPEQKRGDWLERKPKPVVLEGDPEQITALCNSITFKNRYTSGVLSFNKEETAKIAATPGLKEKLIEELRDFAYAGVKQDDSKPLLVVQHEHTERLELHYLIPRVNLESGKYFNPFPPNYEGKRGKGANQEFIKQNDSFVDYVCAKHGLQNPRDPSVAREIKINKFDPNKVTKKKINDQISALVKSESIQSKEDVVKHLQEAGGVITRNNSDYISVKFGDNKAMRLRGGYYSERSFEESRQGLRSAAERVARPIEEIESAYAEVLSRRAGEVEKRHDLKGLAADRAGEFDRKSAAELKSYGDELSALKDSLPGYDQHRDRVNAALASDPVLANGDGPAGIEVGLAGGSSGAEPIMTGDKGSDELIRAFAKMQKKLAAEDIQRAKTRWQIDPKQEQMIRDISDTLSKLFTGLATGKNLITGRPGAMQPADIAMARREIQVQRQALQRELRAVAQVVKQKERTEPLRDILDKPKAADFEAKSAQQLARLVDKNAVLRPDRDIDTVGTIKSLRTSWMRDKVAAVRDEALLWGKKPAQEDIERGVIEAMAKQKVPVSQAYRAVFNESGVCAGNDLAAAKVVTERYAKVALEREGQSLAGVDLEAEARKRFPDVLKRAEKGTLSELKGEAAEQAQERQQDQKRLEAEAEQKRLKLEQQRAAEQLESGRDRSPTPGR